MNIPGLRLDVTLNSRGHWATKARRIKRQRALVSALLAMVPPVALPCLVTITRVSPATRPMDGDNLVSSGKGAVDSVAQWLGIDDNDSRVTWRVEQERGPWGVRITVESDGAETAAVKARDCNLVASGA